MEVRQDPGRRGDARVVTADLMSRARVGDSDAFRELTEAYRRELHVHCYRMLGSFQDAEDALQDTILAAWQGMGGFEGRASLRTWLYRIATNRCLDAGRSASRRPAKERDVANVEPPEATRLGEIVWLEPYPDALLEGAIDMPLGPEARYEQTEAVSLAFVTALQVLPPRQVAVLVLRDSSDSTRARWPACWTRPLNRSTAPSNGPGPACNAGCRRPSATNRLPSPAHPPRMRSWRSSPAHGSRPIWARWWAS